MLLSALLVPVLALHTSAVNPAGELLKKGSGQYRVTGITVNQPADSGMEGAAAPAPHSSQQQQQRRKRPRQQTQQEQDDGFDDGGEGVGWLGRGGFGNAGESFCGDGEQQHGWQQRQQSSVSRPVAQGRRQQQQMQQEGDRLWADRQGAFGNSGSRQQGLGGGEGVDAGEQEGCARYQFEMPPSAFF